MKFGVVNKSTNVNRFVFHTSQRNITHLAVITRKTNIKLGILKGGGKLEKSRTFVGCGRKGRTNLLTVVSLFTMKKFLHYDNIQMVFRN